MNKHLIALAAAATLLAGCGGGSEDSTTQAAPAASVAQLRTTLAGARAVRADAATPEQAADQLFAFAQASIYAPFFPGNPATQSLPPFRYRYYEATGIYLGVVVTAGMGYTMNGVYVMGGAFGNEPVYVGLLTDFITPTDPGTGGPTGPNNGCYDLALLEATGTRIEVAMRYTGDSTGTLNLDWLVNGPKTFEGQSAIESIIKSTGTLTTDAGPGAVDIEAKNYAKRTGDAEVTDYGSESVTKYVVAGFNVTSTGRIVNNPPAVDRQYGLAVGESVTQSTTSTVTTTTVGIPGAPTTPVTSTDTTSETVRFVGREQVTVPANTYSACKFETTIGGLANFKTTTWVIDGKGIPVKTVTTDGATITQTQEATSVKVNGQAL